MYALPLASETNRLETAASILDVLILSAGSAGTHLAVWAGIPDAEGPNGGRRGESVETPRDSFFRFQTVKTSVTFDYLISKPNKIK
ncbi:MAG: hypothetical protein ACI9YT_002597 [Halobacteriales archaeon]|jgi:hypothetical protein